MSTFAFAGRVFSCGPFLKDPVLIGEQSGSLSAAADDETLAWLAGNIVEEGGVVTRLSPVLLHRLAAAACRGRGGSMYTRGRREGVLD